MTRVFLKCYDMEMFINSHQKRKKKKAVILEILMPPSVIEEEILRHGQR